MFHFSVPEIISGTSAVVGPRTSVPAVCTFDIFRAYQHNGGVLVGPWITFHWWVWPDWSTTSRAHRAKCELYSWETQALWLPCHISSRYAEKKGRMSQIRHIPCTQAVLQDQITSSNAGLSLHLQLLQKTKVCSDINFIECLTVIRIVLLGLCSSDNVDERSWELVVRCHDSLWGFT